MRYLAVFLVGCCTFEVEGVCVKDDGDSVAEEDVRSAIRAVENECALTIHEGLTVEFLESPPDASQSGSPIPGVYTAKEDTAKIWLGYPHPYNILRHELIHAALHEAGKSGDEDHSNPKLWCPADMENSCEARIVTSCYSDI